MYARGSVPPLVFEDNIERLTAMIDYVEMLGFDVERLTLVLARFLNQRPTIVTIC